MKFTPNFISIFILTIFVALGSLVLSTDQARAGMGFCLIAIFKDADPADDTPFNFTAPGSDGPDFTLMDPSFNGMSIGFDNSQPVTVTETVPQGWVLEDVVCEDVPGIIIGPFQDNGRTFECTAETIIQTNCTFINTMDMFFVRPIPTLSEWGLIAMAAILGIVGFMVIRRRKAVA